MKLLKNFGLKCGGSSCIRSSEEKVKVGWGSKEDFLGESPLELGSKGV